MKIREKGTVSIFAVIDNRPMFRLGVRKTIQSIAPNYHISDYGSFDELASENIKIEYTHYLIRVGDSPYNTTINNIKKLRLSDKSCKVVLYGYKESVNHMILFFAENINAYVLDNFDERELRECFSLINANKRYLNSQIATELLNIRVIPSSKRKSRLTPTEVKVTDFLIRGMKTSLIAKEMDRSVSTISTIKANIFRKVNVSNIVDLAAIIENSFILNKN